MQASTPYNRILILEEQRIIGYDLGQQLKKRGYCVSYEKTYEDIQTSTLSGLSDIVISSFQTVRNSKGSGKMSGWNFLKGLDIPGAYNLQGDTIIIDRELGNIRCFEKPYRTEEIISFINTLMKTTIQTKSLTINI